MSAYGRASEMYELYKQGKASYEDYSIAMADEETEAYEESHWVEDEEDDD